MSKTDVSLALGDIFPDRGTKHASLLALLLKRGRCDMTQPMSDISTLPDQMFRLTYFFSSP